MKTNIKGSIKIATFMAIMIAMGIPAFSYASTYAYVNQSGQISTVVADTSAIASAIAPGISAHSGVMLVTSTTVTANPTYNSSVTYGAGTYVYVNQSGMVVSVSANSLADASAKAINRDENSGIMLLSGNISVNNDIVGSYISGV